MTHDYSTGGEDKFFSYSYFTLSKNSTCYYLKKEGRRHKLFLKLSLLEGESLLPEAKSFPKIQEDSAGCLLDT